MTFRARYLPGHDAEGARRVRHAAATPPRSRCPTALNATSGVYDVRFRIDHASDADIARLERCLSKFPSIQGVNVEQQGGD